MKETRKQKNYLLFKICRPYISRVRETTENEIIKKKKKNDDNRTMTIFGHFTLDHSNYRKLFQQFFRRNSIDTVSIPHKERRFLRKSSQVSYLKLKSKGMRLKQHATFAPTMLLSCHFAQNCPFRYFTDRFTHSEHRNLTFYSENIR